MIRMELNINSQFDKEMMTLKDNIKKVIHKQAEYREMEDSPRPDTWSANNRPWPGYLTREERQERRGKRDRWG